MANNVDNTEDRLSNLEETLTKTEQFIEKNQKVLLIILVSLAVIVGGYFMSKKFYFEPNNREAQAEMFKAEKYFEMDSLKLALNGDGQSMGFIQIIDEYGSTKAGNLAHYYAGICYLNLGQYDEAITHLKDFKCDDEIVSAIAIGATGDAYMELGNKQEAVNYYNKAAKERENRFTTPIYLMKAAQAYEDLGNNEEALKIYERLKSEFVRSYEGRDAEKHIARIKTVTGKE